MILVALMFMILFPNYSFEGVVFSFVSFYLFVLVVSYMGCSLKGDGDEHTAEPG